MVSILPLTLSGDLGQRHHYLNTQVNQTVSKKVSFQDIEALREETPVDRLFKIDLAIKLKNVDYILKTLKDDDMLYVSRALKCKWLIERKDIINPNYLEDSLFPEMVMPAISKMKHWLYINLTDPFRCQQFYLYYKVAKFEFALKFLSHCDSEFIFIEFPKLLIKITPHYLKIFAEKNPKLVKIYFDALETNIDLVKQYLKDEKKFYNSIKCVLKSDPNLFLDIVEKYHNINKPTKFSPSTTNYILRNHTNRVMGKVEIYVAYVLHMPTVARRLNSAECQDVVIRLARADYVSQWFSYPNVENLVKRVERENRAAFKKRVFVEKNVGERIVECPYKLPSSPVITEVHSTKSHVFLDQEYRPIQLEHSSYWDMDLRCRSDFSYLEECCAMSCPVKSELQILFDEFRFVGFEGTFTELKDRICATSSADRRCDMLLVLVSKSGGRVENVRELLQLALRMRNEPVHKRATIVRSLVKRANAWRLPSDVWDMMLNYAVGLGLDGTKPEAECREGLHAVVIRQLLATYDCELPVRNVFLEDFTTFAEYKLTPTERNIIGTSLQRMLTTAASDADPKVAASYLDHLLDVLNDYGISIRSSSMVTAVTELANRDLKSARRLMKRLYSARVGRRELLRQNLEFKHDDAALLNVLRHDLEAFESDWLIKLLIDGEKANQFVLKLAVYFNEVDGIAEKIRLALQNKIIQEPNVRLARPLATLSTDEKLKSMLSTGDKVVVKYSKLDAALRANMHRSRPATDVLALGWRRAGMKAVAVCAMRSRPAQVTHIVQTLLKEGVKRPVRLALALAPRTHCLADVFARAVTIRPLAALRAALLYFRRFGETADPQIWNIVKIHLTDIDLSRRKGLRYILGKIEWIPEALKPNYCALVYLALNKISDEDVDKIFCDLMKYLPEINDDMLDAILLRTLENMNKDNAESFPVLVIRYLMLSKNALEQVTRFDKIGEPFLQKIYTFRDKDIKSRRRCFFQENFDQIMKSLQYNFAFFDIKYQSCISVIENILNWMHTFLPKDVYFKCYVHIHAIMLYFKAIRQSVKENPELFEDKAKKMSEGVDRVGFMFGKYVAREVAELKSKYFDSVIEIYSDAYQEYLDQYIVYSKSKSKFIAAIIKGMLTECVGATERLGILVLYANPYDLQDDFYQEIQEIITKKEAGAVQFFFNALIIN